MNPTPSKNKTVIIVVVMVVVAFGAYYFYHNSTSVPDGTLLTSSLGGSSDAGINLISLTSTLNNITLDRSIFDDKVFKSFIDFSQPIPPQSKGGRDPFSPPVFGQDTVVPAQTQN
jgi:hypothetical protein